MSVYFIKVKGWRYDFTLKGSRYTNAWFVTKTEAKQAEAKRREEIGKPEKAMQGPTDITFLDLVNARLDYVKAYFSESHYKPYCYMARRWVKKWGGLNCSQITQQMIQQYILERSKISAFTANKDIRYLRAAFNFGKKRKLINANPVDGVEFLPIEKKVKYVPSPEDIDAVIDAADSITQDYLWTLRETMARVGEINRLTWDDVDLERRYVILYTCKKKGGHLTPRKVPMTQKLYDILSRRYSDRDKNQPWVFVNTYKDWRTGEIKIGPFSYRKTIMRTLCKKAGVRHFRFHAIRHAGASIMENSNVPLGAIQRILGHENRTTTEIYLHSIGEIEREAISIYEQFREKSHTD